MKSPKNNRRISSRAVTLLFAVFWMTAPWAISCLAQEAPVDSSELDHWRGSSLGIRIERDGDQVVIDQVHEYVGDTSPLKPDDRLIEISGTEITWANRGAFSEILDNTDPDAELEALIERDGKEQKILLPTYRRELVDIPKIVDQLKANRIIKQHLEDTDRGDYLDTVFDRMVKAVMESESPREAAEAINAIIDEIDVSHTAILPPQSFNQLNGGEAGDLGLTLKRHVVDGQNRYFVTDRMPGSAGYDSEIVLGDEIVSLNNVPIEQSRRLILSGQEHRRGLFFVQVNIEEKIAVEYRRRQNSDKQVVQLEARKAVPAEDVIKLSARVIESGENRYGYIRFWNLMSMRTPSLVRDVVDKKFEGCDMLILDLRGRGGLIPAVIAVDRLVKELDVPVIAITDDLTRSAKEMLSLLLKEHKHVTVVGQRTAGAVTGATMMRLPSGNGFMYPVMSADSLKRFTGDVVLERVGVEPDIELDFQVPWCGGNDRLLEGAIETADDQIRTFLESLILP